MLGRLLDGKGWLGLLILRVVIAYIMVKAGLSKLDDPDIAAEKFANMGVPFEKLSVWLAALAEFIGGICLGLGLFTRYAAMFVSFTMAVAVAASAPNFGFALMVLAGTLCLLFTGPGCNSLDAWLGKRPKINIDRGGPLKQSGPFA